LLQESRFSHSISLILEQLLFLDVQCLGGEGELDGLGSETLYDLEVDLPADFVGQP